MTETSLDRRQGHPGLEGVNCEPMPQSSGMAPSPLKSNAHEGIPYQLKGPLAAPAKEAGIGSQTLRVDVQSQESEHVLRQWEYALFRSPLLQGPETNPMQVEVDIRDMDGQGFADTGSRDEEEPQKRLSVFAWLKLNCLRAFFPGDVLR